MPILPSVLVLTKDEEINIADCLRSLAFSDDIVILDSFSSDRTVEIASQFPNVRVVRRKFDTWSKHSNWALENIVWKNRWVYYSDADERVSQAMRDEILSKLNDDQNLCVAFEVCYRNMFRGRWLKHGGLFPVWIIRLFRPECIRYEDRDVNPRPIVQGSLGRLREPFDHYSFNKGLTHWFLKHDSYSTMEAKEAVRVRAESSAWNHLVAMTSNDRATRRRGLKNLSFFMPSRGILRFIYVYLLKRGALDGAPGACYALMISIYEHWIDVKRREQEQGWIAADARLLEKVSIARGEVNEPVRSVSVVLLLEGSESERVQDIQAAKCLGRVLCIARTAISSEVRAEIRAVGGELIDEGGTLDWQRPSVLMAALPQTESATWIVRLRGGERIGPQLLDELRTLLADEGSRGRDYAFRVHRLFMGRLLRWRREVRVHAIGRTFGPNSAVLVLRNPFYCISRGGISGEIRRTIEDADWLRRASMVATQPSVAESLVRNLFSVSTWTGGVCGLRYAILQVINAFMSCSIIRGG